MSTIFFSFPYLIVFFLHFLSHSYDDQNDLKGVFIITQDFKFEGQESHFHDTIFVHNDFGLEKVTKYKYETINFTSTETEEPLVNYFIDFKQKKYIECDSLDKSNAHNLILHDISKKPSGIILNYKYYNGEDYSIRDTIINEQKLSVLRYIVSGGENNTKKNTTCNYYLDRSTKALQRPSLLSNIEDKFYGRVIKVDAVSVDNEIKINNNYKFIELANHKMIDVIDKLKQRLK